MNGGPRAQFYEQDVSNLPNDAELERPSGHGSALAYYADLAAGHRAGCYQGHSDNPLAEHQGGRDQGDPVRHKDKPIDRAYAIIRDLRLPTGRQEADLVRFAVKASEWRVYTGRRVERVGQDGPNQEFPKDDESDIRKLDIIDKQNVLLNPIYVQRYTKGQAAARRERALAVQAAYRAGHNNRVRDMLKFPLQALA
ncbi:hypothetical protein FKW77_000514 [Venturia effusa]|uniref:Uncharacterized protein n=1 Tax=Venturia effusa TaxID=50376 RepID=A0A517L8E8_9PEZI|nr:hypothetical protein FKW77_000514 [Venturia effusa]